MLNYDVELIISFYHWWQYLVILLLQWQNKIYINMYVQINYAGPINSWDLQAYRTSVAIIYTHQILRRNYF